MTLQTARDSLIALALGFLCQIGQDWLQSDFLTQFLKDNLITLLIALLAINSATMGIVLTKIRDLVDTNGKGKCFTNTKESMLLSIKEQISLIIIGIALLIISESNLNITIPHYEVLISSAIIGVFIFSLMVLYDTAKGVLIIVDFDSSKPD